MWLDRCHLDTITVVGSARQETKLVCRDIVEYMIDYFIVDKRFKHF